VALGIPDTRVLLLNICRRDSPAKTYSLSVRPKTY
jgi:hypothetical protein